MAERSERSSLGTEFWPVLYAWALRVVGSERGYDNSSRDNASVNADTVSFRRGLNIGMENIVLGAAVGAGVGLFAAILPLASFDAGGAFGALTGAGGDLVSQLANGRPSSYGELIGATIGGAVGGAITGGALSGLGPAAEDLVLQGALNVMSAQTGFAAALAGWALGQPSTQAPTGAQTAPIPVGGSSGK